MFNKYVDSFLRHGLSSVGGYLLAIGVQQAAIDNLQSALIPIITGVVTYGVGQVSSIIRAKNTVVIPTKK